MNLNSGKTGKINQKELTFYLEHWGMQIPDDKFQELFGNFDADGDGLISYKDFQMTVGKVMQPDQGAYWRQDMPRQIRIKSCKANQCWHVAQDFVPYCKIHLKMQQHQAFTLMKEMRKRIGDRW